MDEISKRMDVALKMPAKKITSFCPIVLKGVVDNEAFKQAMTLMSKHVILEFARQVKKHQPDAKDGLDSFYCPNNDTFVVLFRGKFYDADVDRDGKVTYFQNTDSDTILAYKEISAITSQLKKQDDPTRVGIFRQQPSQEFKN